MSKFTSIFITEYDCTPFVARYRQLSVFLKLTKPLNDFYFANRLDSRCELAPDDQPLFCYETSEIKTLKIFLRVTRIFDDYTVLLQDEMLNNLPNGIEYFLQIDSFFESCKEVKDGSTDYDHLRTIGLEKKHLSSVEPGVKKKIVDDAYPEFKEHMRSTLGEPGYWVAHLLRPWCKTDILRNTFEEGYQQRILDLFGSYVGHYLTHFRNGVTGKRNKQAPGGSIPAILIVRRKSYKICRRLRWVDIIPSVR